MRISKGKVLGMGRHDSQVLDTETENVNTDIRTYGIPGVFLESFVVERKAFHGMEAKDKFVEVVLRQ